MAQIIVKCNNCGALLIVELGDFLNASYKCYCGFTSAEIVREREPKGL